MDLSLPGGAGSSSQQVPESTSNNQGVATTRFHSHALASSSTDSRSSTDPVTNSEDIPASQSHSITDISVISLHDHGEPHNPKPLAPNTPPGYPDQAQDPRPSQRTPTREKTYLPAQFGPGSFKSVTGPVTTHEFERGHRQHTPSYRQQQQDGAKPLKHFQKDYDEGDIPDRSAVRHRRDAEELFLFKGDAPNGKMREGNSSQDSNENREVVSNQLELEKIQPRAGPNNLRSSRDRIPTPSLDAVLGATFTNDTSRDRSDERVSLQKQEPGPCEERSGSQDGRVRYYDYSEGFEPSIRAASPGPVEALPDGRFHTRGIWRDPADYPQHSLAYVQNVNHAHYFPQTSSDSENNFANLQAQSGSEWSRGYHAFRGEAHHWPPYPVHSRSHSGPYHASSTGSLFSLGPFSYQYKGKFTCGYPYQQASSVPYYGNRGVCGYCREIYETGSHNEQQIDSGRCYRGRPDVGDHKRIGENSSKQENMPPSYTQNSQGTAPQNSGPQGPILSITQAHRRVQDKMKALIPRGLGHAIKGNDGPRIRLSRPIHLAAPKPVSNNIQQRLAENVLSIDNDEALPAGFRNPHDGSSDPSEDGLSDFTTHSLGQTGASLDRKGEQHLRTDTLTGVRFGNNGLRHPRLIARVDSSKKVPTKPREYATPKNIDFQESEESSRRTPYPADTPTELEYRGIVRAQPKVHSDAESQSATRPQLPRWESAKAKVEGAKKGVLSRLGIKTKKGWEAEKLGHRPLTRRAKKVIPGTEHSEGVSPSQHDHEMEIIEKWMHKAGGEKDGAERPRTKSEEPRAEASGHRVNMTTAAGHEAAYPSMMERFMRLKERAFRSKPDLREKRNSGDDV